jgi:hypothetical protein
MHPGTSAPLASVEAAIVKIILNVAQIRQPLTKQEVMKMLSDAIKGTPLQEEFAKYKKKRVQTTSGEDGDELLVGEKWWSNFFKRWHHLLVNKKGERFSMKKENIQQRLVQSKRITAGTLVGNGIHALDNAAFMSATKERLDAKRKDEESKIGMRKATKRKRIDAVKDLREKFGDEKVHRFVDFNKDQCGKYLQYKKKGKEDGKMPEDLDERRARCILWINRPSPNASFDDGGIPDSFVDAELMMLTKTR